MNHTIECTCMLSDDQLTRLQAVTKQIKYYSQNENWTDQMTLQLAIGNNHITEMVLIMLEDYTEEKIK